MEIRCNTELRDRTALDSEDGCPFNWHPADRRTDRREGSCGMFLFYETIHTSKLPLRTGLDSVIVNNNDTFAISSVTSDTDWSFCFRSTVDGNTVQIIPGSY